MPKVRVAILLIAGGLAASSSWAQFVSLSGSVDLVVRRDIGVVGGSRNGLQPGAARSSRLTIQAKEDLGDGFAAHFVLEGNLQPDTGTMGATAPFWNRVAAINLGSDKTGYVSFGRQFTPMQDVSASPSNDPFGGAWLGGIATIYSKTTNASNGFLYHYGLGSAGSVGAVPAVGFSFLALWAPGEGGTLANGNPAPSASGNQLGLGTSYGVGPFWVGASHHRVTGNSAAINAAAPTTDSPILKQSHIGTAYDFGFVRVHLGFNRATNDALGAAEVSRNAWHAGLTAPVGQTGSFRFLFGKVSDHVNSRRNLNTTQIAYLYNLSRRTGIYINAGRVMNGPASTVAFAGTLAAAPPGAHITTLTTGLRHNF